MVGFIGFIIAMAVIGNIIEGLDSAGTQMFITALVAALGGYRFTKRNLAKWLKIKDQKKLDEEKEQLRKEIEEEKKKIAEIQAMQPETYEEPYYPEVKYFNK